MVSQKTFLKIAKHKPEWRVVQSGGVIDFSPRGTSKVHILFSESGIGTLVAFGRIKQFMKKIEQQRRR